MKLKNRGPSRTPQEGNFPPRNQQAGRPSNPALQSDLAHLAETIAQATSVIQAAGLTAGNVFLF